MTPQRFRLDQVLRVRRVQADLAAAALAAAQAQERTSALAESACRDEVARRARLSGHSSGGAVLAARAVWDAQMQVLDRSVQHHAACRALSEEQRGRWVVAHQRVRALENLAERHRAEHRRVDAHHEARRLDDLVAGAHARRIRAEGGA